AQASSMIDEISEDDEVLPEWQEFFIKDEEDADRISMNIEMIKKYRKLDEHRQSAQYKALDDLARAEFERKLEFFGNYYDLTNIVDFLKPFVKENFGKYLQRVKRISALVRSAEDRLGIYDLVKTSEGARSLRQTNAEDLRLSLAETIAELEVSIKDEGDGVDKNELARTRAMQKPGPKVIYYGDNKGVGAQNQKSYETVLFDLAALLDSEHSEESIERAANSREFKGILNGIGDKVTAIIRSNVRHLNTVFKGTGTVVSEGGDETIVVWHSEDNPDMPLDAEEFSDLLPQIIEDTNQRVFAVLTDFTLPRLQEKRERERVTQGIRVPVNDLISIDQMAERALERIKLYEMGDTPGGEVISYL
ncbi:hypothetical protein ACFL2V_06535, partial [Pseudomonadota bacterium]